MKKKILYTSVVILSFFIGVSSTMISYHFYGPEKVIIEKTVSEVEVTEADSISSSIEKIYDATVVVENYQANRKVGSGTGFVYKKDKGKGYIITNYHVIADATKIMVINTENVSVEAKLLGSDEYADIAVLTIEEDAVLDVAILGDSSKSKLGDTVFTVGTPVGSEYMGTVTKGILSGKNRTVSVTLSRGTFMMEVLQTDAAINPGNSGGPLANINGEVIGVNSLKLVEDEIEGMGFAIPIEIIVSSLDRLEKGEEIIRPVLGVELIDASSTYSLYRYGIYFDEHFEKGVVVVNVSENSTASSIGLKKGDVILKIDDVEINETGHFRFLLYKYEIGDNIEFTVYKDGKIQKIKATLK
ncbi:MAG TPA: PDZ domain-containing protein [Tenericutes bacterium]|nr:PDZ domain-containing protein [Mycoplasmatota bacterium]